LEDLGLKPGNEEEPWAALAREIPEREWIQDPPVGPRLLATTTADEMWQMAWAALLYANSTVTFTRAQPDTASINYQ
jgi:hypothetical protein